MARLPSVGQDADAWGSVLNDFLRVAHQDDGSLKGAVTVHTVKDLSFGALGNGQADDTDAIQAAINAAAQSQGMVYIPPGRYRVTKPLFIRASTGAPDRVPQWGLKIVGSSAMASASYPTAAVLVWDCADTTQPLLQVWSRECIIIGVQFAVAAQRTCYAAIQWTEDSSPDGLACTRIQLQNVRISSDGSGGAFTYGITVGEDVGKGFPFNMDFLSCMDVFIGPGVAHSCVYVPNTTGQAKAHSYVRSVFYGAQYGLNYESGSFTTHQCAFSLLTEACVRLVQPTDFIMIRDSDAEHCRRLLLAEGAQAAPWPVTIDGGRFDVASDRIPDGIADEYITWRWPGPLTVRGVQFSPQNPLWYITYDAPFAPLDVPIITFEGCALPTPYPIREDLAGTDAKITIRGCNARDHGNQLTAVPDQDPYAGTQFRAYYDGANADLVSLLEIPIRFIGRMYRLDVHVLARNLTTSIDAALWTFQCGLLTYGGPPVLIGGTIEQVRHTATPQATSWTAQVTVDPTGHVLSAVVPPQSPQAPVVLAQAYPPQTGTYDADAQIEITTGGLRAHAKFRVSLDGGRGWSAPLPIPATGVYVVGGLGVQLAFADGQYTEGAIYTFTTRVPKLHVQVRGPGGQTIRWQATAALVAAH